MNEKGVTLVEVLVGIILLSVICIASLGFFTFGLGGMAKEGNRRAALEQARARMEQLLSSDASALPTLDGTKYWCSAGDPCTTWSNTSAAQTVTVNDLTGMRIETTGQGVHDASAGTPVGFYDAWELGVKVWFTPRINNDDDYNRIYIKTLRAREL